MDHNKDGCGPGSTQKMEWLIVIEEDRSSHWVFGRPETISPPLSEFAQMSVSRLSSCTESWLPIQGNKYITFVKNIGLATKFIRVFL